MPASHLFLETSRRAVVGASLALLVTAGVALAQLQPPLRITGTIESFSYDVPATTAGFDMDVANVRTASGELVPLAVTELEPAA